MLPVAVYNTCCWQTCSACCRCSGVAKVGQHTLDVQLSQKIKLAYVVHQLMVTVMVAVTLVV